MCLKYRFVFEFWSISLVTHSTFSYALIIGGKCQLDWGNSTTYSKVSTGLGQNHSSDSRVPEYSANI